MLLIPLDRHRLELLFVAALDPKRASVPNGRRNTAWGVQTSGNVVTDFHQPCFAIAFTGELPCSTNAGGIGVGCAPPNEARWEFAFADGGHVSTPHCR